MAPCLAARAGVIHRPAAAIQTRLSHPSRPRPSSLIARRGAGHAAITTPHRRPPPLHLAAAASSSSSSAGNGASDDDTPESSTGPRPIREQLARYGLGAFAAYGILSNLNAGVLIVIAWLGVVKKLGTTPLDAANPQAAGLFAASYAALYLTSNLMRPIRLSLAIGAAPFFNGFLDAVQRRLRLSRPSAFAVLLLMIATGTLTTITTALWLLGGFPQGLPSPAGLNELMKGLKEGVKAAKAAAGGG